MPSPITPRHQALRDLCAVFGFEHVRSLRIDATVGEAVTVTVERLVMDDEADRLLEVITEHQLVPDAGQPVFVPDEVLSGDDVTSFTDDSRKYAP